MNGNGVIDSAESFDFENPVRRGPNGMQIEAALAEAGVSLPPSSSSDASPKDYSNPDGTINEKEVYAELASLISEGNRIVSSLAYVDPNGEGTLSGMASVLASVRQMIADFVGIHDSYLKHKQKIEIEAIKEESKIKIEKMKHDMKKNLELEKMSVKHKMELEKMAVKQQFDIEKIEASKKISDESQQTGSIGFSQTDIAKALRESSID